MSADKCPLCGGEYYQVTCNGVTWTDKPCRRDYSGMCEHAEHLAIERAKEIETLTKNLADAQGDNAQEAMENKQLAEQVENLKADMERMRSVIEAAKCIRHWHDSGKDGMIVSRDKVFKLWDELKNLDEIERLKSTRLEIPPPPEGFEAVLHLAQIQGQCSQADFELTHEGWKKPRFGISSAQIIARKKERKQ